MPVFTIVVDEAWAPGLPPAGVVEELVAAASELGTWGGKPAKGLSLRSKAAFNGSSGTFNLPVGACGGWWGGAPMAHT